MTKHDTQPQGILNNAIVGLLILFTVPALLVFGAFLVLAMRDRIPGGEVTTCERTLDNGITLQIERYAYLAGLTTYETQTFFNLNGDELQLIIKDDVQAPRGISCEDNIFVVNDTTIIYTQKSIATTTNQGDDWFVYYVCDDPRPDNGRCDKDPLNIVDVTFSSSQQGQITVRESLVDEYGQPLSENGEPIVINEYKLQTNDAGSTWILQDLP